MKRFSINLLVFVLALLTSHGMKAQNVLFEETFAMGMGEFKVEGDNGFFDDLWEWVEAITCAKADASNKIGDDEAIESYLVSPYVTLGTGNTATFNQQSTFFNDFVNEFGLVIREAGTTVWTHLEIPGLEQSPFNFVNVGDIAIPAEFDNSTVEFGFMYKSPGNYNSGIIHVEEFSVKGFTDEPIKKVDPQISYGITEMNYDMADEFVAPVLSNPNMVFVTYSSSDEAVARVDEHGVVTVESAGTTTIKAHSAETYKYLAADASYVLNVTGAAQAEKADPEIFFNTDRVKAFMGKEFTAPELVNPHGVEVVYGSDNLDVAIVDAATGMVTLVAEGTARITATSVENDQYKSASVSYELVVKSEQTDNILFEEEFATKEGFKRFTTEGGEPSVWWFNNCAYADGFEKADEMTSWYLVSPEITLKDKNIASFEYSSKYFNEENLAKEMAFSIREAGGQWEDLSIPVCILSNDDFVYSGEIIIPDAYNGKNVQVALKYSADGSFSSGVWSVRNLVVSNGAVTVDKKDPELDYPIKKYDVALNETFEMPELYNPYKVVITYSSDAPEVAAVDAVTGAVTLMAEGTAKITATSAEDEQFKSGTASYTITVTPAHPDNVLFEESFATFEGYSKFSVEGAESSPWIFITDHAQADGFDIVQEMTTWYLVSPEITLKNGNTATFDYSCKYFIEENLSKEMAFSVREVGGEWEDLVIPVCELCPDQYLSSGEIIIPESFNGKKVQVAFKYSSDGGFDSGAWFVKNLVVAAGKEAPEQKADPEISFPEEEYTYVFGPDKFEAPVLNNPNGVEVLYSADNLDVADVDPITGEVSVYNYGTVVITASSKENDHFLAGSASYTLVITDVPTGIEGISADDLANGKVYNLQGMRVNKLGKGIYVVNGRKIVVK